MANLDIAIDGPRILNKVAGVGRLPFDQAVKWIDARHLHRVSNVYLGITFGRDLVAKHRFTVQIILEGAEYADCEKIFRAIDDAIERIRAEETRSATETPATT